MNTKLKKLDERIYKEQYKYPEIELLKSIPGVGTISAMMIIAEIADHTRFETPQKLVAYAGLVPSTYQSSQTQYNGHNTMDTLQSKETNGSDGYLDNVHMQE